MVNYQHIIIKRRKKMKKYLEGKKKSSNIALSNEKDAANLR